VYQNLDDYYGSQNPLHSVALVWGTLYTRTDQPLAASVDIQIVGTLLDNYDEIFIPMRRKRAAARKFYEQRFSERMKKSFRKPFLI